MGHKHFKYRSSAPKEIPLPLEFPEHRYPPQTNVEDYWKRIELGAKRVKKIKLGVVGTCRDISHTFKRTRYYITKIGELFADYELFIYESDSLDRTPQLLEEWAKENPKMNFQSEVLNLPRLQDLSKTRFEVMATVRNKYVRYAHENMTDCDYFCVIDMDLRVGPDLRGLMNSFGYTELWDIITSNGLDLGPDYYYDLAIYYSEDFTEGSMMLEMKDGASYATLKKGYTRPRFECGEPPIKVHSAFGGMAFYTADTFLSGQYGVELCDHAAFHKNLYDQNFRRLFINPSQILIR